MGSSLRKLISLRTYPRSRPLAAAPHLYKPLISLPQLENGGVAAILPHFSSVIKLARSVPGNDG